MKRSTKLVIVSLSLAVILLGGTYATFAPSRPKTATVASHTIDPPTNAELLSLVNAERAKVGVKPLTIEPKLNESAQFKADDEVNRGYFGHQDPNTGKNNGIDYAFTLTGMECKTISENLAWEPDHSLETAANAVAWWMTSTPHRTAMLSPIYTVTGFGFNKDVIVEHFCQQ